jgi:26S proteasome regulatory subunit N12
MSERYFSILGLNLLRLLAQNRIADFHSQLVSPRRPLGIRDLSVQADRVCTAQETVSTDALASAPVQFPVQVEQAMMEGSYKKASSRYHPAQVLDMRNNLPLPSYGVFMDMLKETLR